jgi:hypothetical protein
LIAKATPFIVADLFLQPSEAKTTRQDGDQKCPHNFTSTFVHSQVTVY